MSVSGVLQALSRTNDWPHERCQRRAAARTRARRRGWRHAAPLRPPRPRTRHGRSLVRRRVLRAPGPQGALQARFPGHLQLRELQRRHYSVCRSKCRVAALAQARKLINELRRHPRQFFKRVKAAPPPQLPVALHERTRALRLAAGCSTGR